MNLLAKLRRTSKIRVLIPLSLKKEFLPRDNPEDYLIKLRMKRILKMMMKMSWKMKLSLTERRLKRN